MQIAKATEVLLTLDKPRRFLYDLNALVELEEIYGSQEKAFEGVRTGKLKHILNVFWACLVHEDNSLTVKDVGRIFSRTDPDIIVELSDIILKAATSE